jgi:amidase
MRQSDDFTGRLESGGSEESNVRERGNANNEVNRRAFLGMGSLGAAAAFAALGGVTPARGSNNGDRFDVEEVSIAELQAAMASGKLTAGGLVEAYLARIEKLDQGGPEVNSVLELNPDALAIARALDAERRMKGPRGPLHGIPVFVK